MPILNSIITWVLKQRISQIEEFCEKPFETQQETFEYLVKTAKDTEFGKANGFESIKSVREFRERIPVMSYEGISPYIERQMKGERNILWPSEVRWFSKSSGTTNARSKFIPVSEEALEECHYKGGKDMLSVYLNQYPDSKMFTGKGLGIGGSYQPNPFDPSGGTNCGDVSALIIQNLPFWAQLSRTPDIDIALMDEWEAKIEKMAKATVEENVTSIAGVPTWTLVLLQRILEMTGKNDISEVWPNLEVFVHGAVAFGPYRSVFRELISRPDMRYLETYNASEGFFGIQDRSDHDDMLLMLDYGIFYEFIPLENLEDEYPQAVGLEDVELGKNYAMVISTNAGLWRYLIGDTVKFTTKSPYRIKISGRTKHFINAFGEEVIVENAERAITEACTQTGASIANFTAGPRYLGKGEKGGHEWIVEFKRLPSSVEVFTRALDGELRRLNSDYDAKRYADIALEMPVVHAVEENTFYNWMKSRGKLGGQHKVPRLSNNRVYLDDILGMIGRSTG
ncbi:hypothetical protein FUAX_00940 [Fulvitalea axinellae]|uniref:GH3 auxin-responsive promoter n=1 Tax=Fulvitalea axinellae TaxID=1182444 RepID=A0AAU9CII8_9BACT|nr:hypothetical protein FUAX_00940 [Fulvitalea axinellae]